MRHFSVILAVCIAFCASARPAFANCAIIAQLDNLYKIQTRLANDPMAGLFQTDIRQLRAISQQLGNGDAVDAVNGNRLIGAGAAMVALLDDTRVLLQRASMDDPQSVRAHYTRNRRQDLQAVGGYLADLRCTADQIRIAQADVADDPIRATSDAEDLEQVVAVLNDIAEEIFRPRTLIILVALGAIASILGPLLRQWLISHRRRAKRHNTIYDTQYQWQGETITGTLVDINCLGTKLQHDADAPLPHGKELSISLAGNWCAGTVVWSNVHYAGVQFKRSISLAQVSDILSGSDAPK